MTCLKQLHSFRILHCALCIVLAALCATSAQAAGSLPAGYTEIEYIQAPGNGRIVTDYTPQPNIDKIEAVVEWPANTLAANVNHAVWCARGATTTTDTWTLFALGTNFRFDYKVTPGTALTPALATGTKYTVVAEENVFTWSGGRRTRRILISPRPAGRSRCSIPTTTESTPTPTTTASTGSTPSRSGARAS